MDKPQTLFDLDMPARDYKGASIQDLPIELLEQIADFIAVAVSIPINPDAVHASPFVVNPFTRSSYRRDDPKLNLIAFASTCKAFRLAALRHLPELVADITIYTFSEMERIQTHTQMQERLCPNVRHITLDFAIPLHISTDRLKTALVMLCIHPSLGEQRCFDRLEGVSFTSRFLNSYTAHENVRRDWHAEALNAGMSGWQARLFGGVASFSSILNGGQSMADRWGNGECLFLTWDKSNGETWTTGHELVFKDHLPPPISVPSLPSAPMKLLLTSFPPSAPRAPPLLAHPSFHASHLIVSNIVSVPKSAFITPLRPFAALRERVQNAYLLKAWDEERAKQGLGIDGQGGGIFWDEQQTALLTAVLVNRFCFTIPEPQIMDALERLKITGEVDESHEPKTALEELQKGAAQVGGEISKGAAKVGGEIQKGATTVGKEAKKMFGLLKTKLAALDDAI